MSSNWCGGSSERLLLECPPPDGINQVWVGDICYVPLQAGDFLYLAILMDLYSRRIVAWELRDHMRESLVLAALREAIALRNPRAGLIHHSDRGGQYAGKKYRGILERAEICQSMSRADSCYDNAFMESVTERVVRPGRRLRPGRRPTYMSRLRPLV